MGCFGPKWTELIRLGSQACDFIVWGPRRNQPNTLKTGRAIYSYYFILSYQSNSCIYSSACIRDRIQLRLLQELCQTSVLERTLHWESGKSQSRFLPAQEKLQKQISHGFLLGSCFPKQEKLFCQTISITASLLLQRSQSRRHFQRN